MNAEYVVNDWRAVLCGYTWSSLDSLPGTNIFWDLQSLTSRSSPSLQLRRASDLIFWRHQCHSPAATRISLNIWPPSYDSLLLVCRTKSSFDYALPSISRKMTDIRGRPYVARRRSRSAPPRSSSNSSEPNSQDTSNTGSAQGRGRPNKRRYATRRRLWLFFLDIPVAPAFLGVILMVILTRDIVLPQVCDLAAVRGTSRALSGFVQVDVCNAAHADDTSHPAGGSAAVAAIQRGQAIGQAIHDLIDSYHELAQYSETVGRIRDLTPRLSTRMIKPSKDGIDILRSTQNRRIMIQFFKTYDSAKKDLCSVIDLAVTEFGGVSGMFDITVRNAYKRPSQYCASLENHVLGRWYSQSSPEASLLSELTRTTTALDPKLLALR